MYRLWNICGKIEMKFEEQYVLFVPIRSVNRGLIRCAVIFVKSLKIRTAMKC